jgi:two-component system, cell cycle response regulator DivK
VAKRVLVVEDNELNLKLFCDLLRAHDFAVAPVSDGREAVAKAREFAPELIVMDIQMPHVTGYDLIREMKRDAELRAIPIMAVTAYAGREDEERIRSAGANAYVSKPISLARFMAEVRALVPSDPVEEVLPASDDSPAEDQPETEA